MQSSVAKDYLEVGVVSPLEVCGWCLCVVALAEKRTGKHEWFWAEGLNGVLAVGA